MSAKITKDSSWTIDESLVIKSPYLKHSNARMFSRIIVLKRQPDRLLQRNPAINSLPITVGKNQKLLPLVVHINVFLNKHLWIPLEPPCQAGIAGEKLGGALIGIWPAGGCPIFGGGPKPGGCPIFGGGPKPGGRPIFGGGPKPGGCPIFGGGPKPGGCPIFGGGPKPGGCPIFGGKLKLGGPGNLKFSPKSLFGFIFNTYSPFYIIQYM